MKTSPSLATVAIVLSAALTALAVTDSFGDDLHLPEIDGVFGMESTGEGAWLAVRLEIPTGYALAGLNWFNNDEGTLFEELLVGTGYTDSPGLLTEFMLVAEEVVGESSDWSTVAFMEPVVASLGNLYVAFALPPDELLESTGQGGGPGFGYCSGGVGARGWLSGDGEVWAHLHENYGFAVLPMLVQAEDGMAVKRLGGEEERETPPIEPFMSVGPNPFNPTISIRFGLSHASKVDVSVYDLKGRRIRRIVDEYRPAGTHRVAWDGHDGSGRQVASGVYLLRMNAGEVRFTRQVVLVK